MFPDLLTWDSSKILGYTVSYDLSILSVFPGLICIYTKILAKLLQYFREWLLKYLKIYIIWSKKLLISGSTWNGIEKYFLCFWLYNDLYYLLVYWFCSYISVFLEFSIKITILKDKDSKYRLILVESRIHRLARYYKTKRQLPATWKYESATASALVS